MESLNALLDLARGAVTFFLVLTVLIAVHELGHYWVAKLFGMKVDAFAVMVGGIRKTPLEATAPKKMVPASWVAAAYSATAVVAFVSANQRFLAAFEFAMLLLGCVLPVWIALRLANLYHMQPIDALRRLGACYMVGLFLLAFGTGFRGVTLINVLAVLIGASLVGLLIIYYAPLGMKIDDNDDSMGHGAIQVNNEPMHVRYRPIWHTTNKEGTEFSLLALPLGGFAKIRGMVPKEDGGEAKILGGFYTKPAFARLMTLFAGPLFSVVLGVLILFSAFAVFGVHRPTEAPVIGGTSPKGAAAQAGLKDGDRFVSIDGQPITNFYDAVAVVRDRGGKAIPIVIERAGIRLEKTVTPILDEEPTMVLGADLQPTGQFKRQGKLGIGPEVKTNKVGPAEALQEAFAVPGRSVRSFIGLFMNADAFKANVGGPAAIASATQEASRSGFESVLLLAGQLSIAVGIMNLLPVPPLDGGQMVVAFAEMLRGGRRLSLKVQHTISTVGFMLVLTLMLFALSQDIGRNVGR